MTLDDFKAATARCMRNLRRLPYLVGRVVMRWYLLNLYKHYLISSASEMVQAKEHQAAADHFLDLADALRPELDAAYKDE